MGTKISAPDERDPVEPESGSQSVFIDPSELAESLVRVLGLRSKRLRGTVAQLRHAVNVAGPAAIARVLADEAELTESQARRLVALLLEMQPAGGER